MIIDLDVEFPHSVYSQPIFESNFRVGSILQTENIICEVYEDILDGDCSYVKVFFKYKKNDHTETLKVVYLDPRDVDWGNSRSYFNKDSLMKTSLPTVLIETNKRNNIEEAWIYNKKIKG